MRWDYPPLDINPVFPCLGGQIIIIIIIIYYRNINCSFKGVAEALVLDNWFVSIIAM